MRVRQLGLWVGPFRVYLVTQAVLGFALAVSQATLIVYLVRSAHLDPFELVLLGTVLEAAYFLFQVPTGVLADRAGRRRAVVLGFLGLGAGLVLQGSVAALSVILAAQVVYALGAALVDGALEACIADELQDRDLGRVYTRGTQVGLLATVAGSLASALLLTVGNRVPLLAAGSLLVAFAVLLTVVMPERHFQPAQMAPPAGRTIITRLLAEVTDQVGATSRAVRQVTGLLLVLAVVFFVGGWSESFDRLWGAFLLRDVGLPSGGRFGEGLLFGLLAAASALLALGATEIARRRTERLGSTSVLVTLLVTLGLVAAGVVVFATASTVLVAVPAYLAVSALRPVYRPLLTLWIVERVEPAHRATALSTRDLFDSCGQILGGPLIGLVGTLATVRAALLCGAAAFIPATALLALANTQVTSNTASAEAGGPKRDRTSRGRPRRPFR